MGAAVVAPDVEAVLGLGTVEAGDSMAGSSEGCCRHLKHREHAVVWRDAGRNVDSEGHPTRLWGMRDQVLDTGAGAW